MFNCIFLAPYLKYNNQKIYILNHNDNETINYENETYYIDDNDMNYSGSITYNNNVVKFEIISKEDNQNIVIKASLKEAYEIDELIKVLHNIHCNIVKLENINEITDNLIAKYSKKYIIYNI